MCNFIKNLQRIKENCCDQDKRYRSVRTLKIDFENESVLFNPQVKAFFMKLEKVKARIIEFRYSIIFNKTCSNLCLPQYPFAIFC